MYIVVIRSLNDSKNYKAKWFRIRYFISKLRSVEHIQRMTYLVRDDDEALKLVDFLDKEEVSFSAFKVIEEYHSRRATS